MKILFIAQNILRKELGGPKVVIELSEAINKQGHDSTVVGPEEITVYLQQQGKKISKVYAENISVYLLDRGDSYDIVDVDIFHIYNYLEQNVARNFLLIGRSVLFIPHMKLIKWPMRYTLGYLVKLLLNQVSRKYTVSYFIKKLWFSLEHLDVINVSNKDDLQYLTKRHVPLNKVIVLPYGMHKDRRDKLHSVLPSTSNTIVFVGTFDFRKGCLDIPKIFELVKKEVPDAQLILLGARGLFQDEDRMLSFFPKDLRGSVKIILEYESDKLQAYLQDCRVGLFPSYLEGFGFGVIELISAGIPVIAYASPGPSDILPTDYLVPAGDYKSMAKKLVYFLKEKDAWQRAHDELKQLSDSYDWELIAQQTVNLYGAKSNKNL